MSETNQTASLEATHPGEVVETAGDKRLARELAPLIGRAATRRLLTKGGGRAALRMSAEEIASVSDVPLRIAERVVAARAIGELVAEAHAHRGPTLSCSEEAIRHLPPGFAQSETEYLVAFALDVKNGVKATVLLAKGGDANASVCARDVFTPLVRLAAAAFILAHCHPSGDPTPSHEDVELTNALSRAGRVLGVDLIDHLVVGSRGVVSLYDAGLLLTERELGGQRR